LKIEVRKDTLSLRGKAFFYAGPRDRAYVHQWKKGARHLLYTSTPDYPEKCNKWSDPLLRSGVKYGV